MKIYKIIINSLIIVCFMLISAKSADNILVNESGQISTLKPEPVQNLKYSVNYIQGEGENGLYYVSITWDSPCIAKWQKTDENSNPEQVCVDDVNYIVKRQELRSDFNPEDKEEEIVQIIDNIDGSEFFNTGGDFIDAIDAKMPSKYKYTVIAWDRSVGITNNINDSMSEANVTVELITSQKMCPLDVM